MKYRLQRALLHIKQQPRAKLRLIKQVLPMQRGLKTLKPKSQKLRVSPLSIPELLSETELGLGSADAVGDQHGQGGASAVGDQQDMTSGVAGLFVFVQSALANLLPESLQKGDRLFTGDSMTRLLV